MTFNAMLTAAVKKYAGSSGSGDKIEFEKRKGAANIACFINGIGGSGKTAEAALKQALGRMEQVSSGAFWVGHKAEPVRRTSKKATSKKRTSKKRTSKKAAPERRGWLESRLMSSKRKKTSKRKTFRLDPYNWV